MAKRERDLRPDELVSKLAPEGGEPPNATLIVGFLGSSALEGHQRLYLDAGLSTYVDIPDAAIVHAEKTEIPGSGTGTRTNVWVRRGTQLQQTVVDTRQVQAEFLQGDIVGPAPGGGPTPPGAGLAGLAALWPRQTWGFECDPWPRPSLVTCSQWCRFTEAGPRCTMAGPRCRSIDICPSDIC